MINNSILYLCVYTNTTKKLMLWKKHSKTLSIFQVSYNTLKRAGYFYRLDKKVSLKCSAWLVYKTPRVKDSTPQKFEDQ